MSISIHLDEDRESFAPGGTITGDVRWNGLDVNDKSVITLELSFHTEGKGTSQREVFSQHEWPVTIADGNEAFSIEAPKWPWSFSGKLVSVLWTLVAWHGDEHAKSSSVTISPNGEELDLYHYGVDEIEKSRWEKIITPPGN